MTRYLAGVILAALTLPTAGCEVSRNDPPRLDYREAAPALTEAGLVNMVVEIPAGTNDKYQVDKSTGSLEWEIEDGVPRVVQYLAYPANYGMIPSTSLPKELGGDGDPLDIILLGPPVERGVVVQVRPVGVLLLTDDGERDDKIVAVALSGPLSDVEGIEALEARYGGALTILETWFTNYKGPDRVTSSGFSGAPEAIAVVQEASDYFRAFR